MSRGATRGGKRTRLVATWPHACPAWRRSLGRTLDCFGVFSENVEEQGSRWSIVIAVLIILLNILKKKSISSVWPFLLNGLPWISKSTVTCKKR